ncbi:MAG: class I tRNA ligase family protein [Ekhidna sp.]|uniref:leucine--tRNA ligase n=1 Tax=Ekhidna sp. TaxID=2608089 RepID=UPI0032EC3EBF
MAEYNFQEIEKKWQQYWKDEKVYEVSNDSEKPKYYILDMFPYPSGAGLHVGHPLGYIASDIVARFKRLNGFNVLHPMGFDSFGLPAEQYAIQTGQHPAITTEKNITRYKEQLKALGFSYDWSREVRTSDPKFYKWTQWIFKLIYNSWYNQKTDKAEHIDTLIALFEKEGNQNVEAVCDEDTPAITADQWNGFSEKEKQEFLSKYRLTYLAETTVNWCPALGTVLSNDEVKDGFSERGGHPVVKKKMPQWSMRITAYADRLLSGLDKIDWPEPIKEMQRNWIGKSIGAVIDFEVLTPNPSPMERGTEKWKTANPVLAKKLIEFARGNRKNSTPEEDILWQKLRNKKLGYKVRRQHPVGDFIADFIFLKEKLIVEVDGPYHDQEEQRELDLARKEYLESLGYQILVVKNEAVNENLSKVLSRIKSTLDKVSSEAPSPSGKGSGDGATIQVFTTRIDTIYGATFCVLAPEHELINQITTPEQKAEVDKYVSEAINRSERERMSDVKKVTGVFTGAYAINPFSKERIPIWTADYVLAGYGTGAVMAVPAHDERDHRFAKQFGLKITQVIAGETDVQEEAFTSKDAAVINSDFLNGLPVSEAIQKAIAFAEEKGFGKAKVNFRLRDAIFGRQRYWGEPIPVYYENGVPKLVSDEELPLDLPKIDEYLPTQDGDPPLGRAKDWNYNGHPFELSTMPGWAGSSWYFFRYMDPHNEEEFCSKEAMQYWQDVDFYMGGSEHATGHLLYSRFWTKFLYDMGIIEVDEYAKKLVNQGMIQGRSSLALRVKLTINPKVKMPINVMLPVDPNNLFVYFSKNLVDKYFNGELEERMQKEIDRFNSTIHNPGNDELISNFFVIPETRTPQVIHIPIEFVSNDVLDIEGIKKSYNSIYLTEDDGQFYCKWEVEKMSKSKFNVVNPDELVERYGADTLRMYEMFLGPIEQSKPWNTNGIEGVYKFLRKFWSLFHDGEHFSITEEAPTKEELKVLHSTIKKIADDAEKLSLNTSVSTFMIATNELSSLKCNKRAILEPLTIILSPFAPHIAEELWHLLGHDSSVVDASYPEFEAKHLVEDSFEYPVMVNGKMRAKLTFPTDAGNQQIEEGALSNETIQKWLDGKAPKKVIVVPKKIVNIVI